MNFKLLEDKYQYDKTNFSLLQEDLKKVRELNPFVSEIGIDGGSIVDMIYGYPVSDYDIRYSIFDKDTSRYSTKCKCNEIATTIEQNQFNFLTGENVDLDNISESLLNLSLKHKYEKGLVGNNCFTNTILFTDEGEFICPEEAYEALINREYVPNYYGYLHYSYDASTQKDYYKLVLEMLVRGVAYINKRKLSCHKSFYKILELYEPLKKCVPDYESIVKMKFSSVEEFEQALSKIW